MLYIMQKYYLEFKKKKKKKKKIFIYILNNIFKILKNFKKR